MEEKKNTENPEAQEAAWSALKNLPEVISSEDTYYQMMIRAYLMRAEQNATEDIILATLEVINARCEPIGATDTELSDYARAAMEKSPAEAREEADRLTREFRWAESDRQAAAAQVTTESGNIKIKEPPKPLSIIRADELSKMDIEQPMFIVKDILPVGLGIVASPPKYGKSWLMLDLCTAAALGVPFLGHDTNQCHTLYLALEDSEARLKGRMMKILRGRADPPSGCAITTHAMDIEHGLVQQLSEELEKDSDLKLIVIDTFQKVRSGSKRNETDYAADYREVGAIKEMADKYKVAVVLVTHVRKMKDPTDPFSNISGTSGLTGAADTMIVLNKEKRTDTDTIMSVTGRDVNMNEWYINFDKLSCRWSIKGTCEEVQRDAALEAYNNSPIVATIKGLLKEEPEGWRGTASQFIEESRRLRQYVNVDNRHLKKEFEKVRYWLEDNDGIEWDTISNGSGGTRHCFHYGRNPFVDGEEPSEDGSTQEAEDGEQEFWKW